MQTIPETGAVPTFSTATGTNAAAVITLAADDEEVHVIDWIHYSFDQVPAAALTLTVAIGGVTKFTRQIAAGLVQSRDNIPFEGGLYGEKGDAVVITLGAGGATVVGTVNARSR